MFSMSKNKKAWKAEAKFNSKREFSGLNSLRIHSVFKNHIWEHFFKKECCRINRDECLKINYWLALARPMKSNAIWGQWCKNEMQIRLSSASTSTTYFLKQWSPTTRAYRAPERRISAHAPMLPPALCPVRCSPSRSFSGRKQQRGRGGVRAHTRVCLKTAGEGREKPLPGHGGENVGGHCLRGPHRSDSLHLTQTVASSTKFNSSKNKQTK